MMISYARAKYPTPVLNRPDFSYVFGRHPQGILLDSSGLLRPLEMIALEGEVFTVIRKLVDQSEIVFEVTLECYPSKTPLYIDSRFVEEISSKPPYLKKEKPLQSKILKKLESLIGFPYVWGGNWSQGVSQLMQWYPPKRVLTSLEKANWSLQGIDCSGLLYEVFDGFAPRNVSDLFSHGKALEIENNSIKEIISKVNPLDLILWKGHVVIIFDKNTTIESRAHRGGVFFTSLKERLELIRDEEKKLPLNLFKTEADAQQGFLIRSML